MSQMSLDNDIPYEALVGTFAHHNPKIPISSTPLQEILSNTLQNYLAFCTPILALDCLGSYLAQHSELFLVISQPLPICPATSSNLVPRQFQHPHRLLPINNTVFLHYHTFAVREAAGLSHRS
jgi:hypothetical protein